MMLQFEEEFAGKAIIRVAGVGGAGGNAVNGMVESGLHGVEFISVNTDAQALQESAASTRIQIGGKVTRGLGSGGDPQVGARAVEEDHQLVAEALQGSDMVFVTAGMGGGTGTGAAPTVARIARDLGALVVGIVTLPFTFEGRKRGRQALEGLEELRKEVDTIIVIQNDRLLKVVPAQTPLLEAFRVADNVLYQATKGISDLITVPGLVNLDFADVRSIMAGMGDAIMGTGAATGENRAVEAANAAISSPLLEDIDIRGAQGVLVNITGGSDMSLHEVSEVTSLVQEAVGDEANLIFGAVISDEVENELRVTVIATGFGDVTAKNPGKRAAETAAGASASAPVVEVPRPIVRAESEAASRPVPRPHIEPSVRDERPVRPEPEPEPETLVQRWVEPEPAPAPTPKHRIEFELPDDLPRSEPAPRPERGDEVQAPDVSPERHERLRTREAAAGERVVQEPVRSSQPEAPSAFRRLVEEDESEADEAPRRRSGGIPSRSELEEPSFLRRLRD